jgi:hypothetical protein
MFKPHTIILTGFLLRIIVAVWNGFWGPSFGADLDALAFHDYATQTARGESGDRDFLVGWIYAFILGKVYSFLGASLFLGSLLSCIAWGFSSLILLKIIKLLKIPKPNAMLILVLYALLPGSILLTAVTLREAYQMLFVNTILLCGLHLMDRFSLRYWVLFLLSAFGAGMLHSAIAAYAALSVVSIYLASFFFAGRSKKWLLVMLSAAVLIGLLVNSIGPNLGNGLALAVSTFREGTLMDARADYSSEVNIAGLSDLVILFPYLIFQYLFEPLPWKMSSVMDVYVLSENMLRFYLIVKAIAIIRSNHPTRLAFTFLFINYFLLEAIWALGTNNWGTALRHHLPMLGCLLLIGLGGHSIVVKRRRAAGSKQQLAS